MLLPTDEMKTDFKHRIVLWNYFNTNDSFPTSDKNNIESKKSRFQ